MRFTLFLVLLAVLGLLVGCGSERTEQQNTVEQEVYEIGPMTIETPAGTVVLHKTAVVRKMSRYRTTTEQQQYTFPEVRDLGGALLGGLGGPLAGGGLVGLVAAWFMKRSAAKAADEKAEMEADAARAKRQRDEIIEGIEASKDRLSEIKVDDKTTAWDSLTTDLERKQSRDTVQVIKERTP